MPVLEASGIRKRFGGVVALAGAALSLDAGEVHALLGSNGCGKSTLCKIVAGAVRADDGRVALAGKPVAFAGPDAAAAAGIGVFYQELSLIPQLTVAENLYLGREPSTRLGLIDRRALRAAAEQSLAAFGTVLGGRVDPDTLVADLSADQSQIVEILKVLAGNPRIVIFDEPTAALDRNQTAVLFEQIRRLKAVGRSVIFISHRMDEVFEIADRVTVMRNGHTVMTRPTRDTTRDEIVAAMVGGALVTRDEGERRAPADDVALEVEDLHARRLSGVSFKVRRGELVGLGGLHGQGQSELLRALFGAALIRRGLVRLNGKRLDARGPRAHVRRAIAYISGDRARYGVFAIRPIFENLVLALLARDRPIAVAKRRREGEIAPIIARLNIKFSSLAAPIADLSGGNQQKVVIGRWLATQPAVLLLDDPTKGIDIQTKTDLYRTLDELRAQGAAILLHSSDDEELLAVADRILVFNGGQIVAELAGDERTHFALYRAAYSPARTDAGS